MLKKKLSAALALTCSLFATSALAVTETVLYSFKAGPADGSYPYAGVTMDSHGNLYGTTSSGGTYGINGNRGGIVWKLTPSPTGVYVETVLYNFGGALDGNTPYSGVTIDALGNLFGSTLYGSNVGLNNGTFYRISPLGFRWFETGLFSFPGAGGGANPEDLGTVIQGPQGYFYGTSMSGGAYGQGNVFKIDESADETVLYSFNHSESYPDGTNPTAGLVADAAGNLYGTTTNGGLNSNGTVYELVLQEGSYAEVILHSFGLGTTDGASPVAGLSMDLQGNLYGTTKYGGSYGRGTVFELIRLSAGGWQEKILYNFGQNLNDGTQPWGRVIIDHDGNLYGTTYGGGTGGDGAGIVFKLSPTGIGINWTETILHQFAESGDVGNPYDGLFMDSTGALYGTGSNGGAHGFGGVFKIVP